MLTVVIFGAGNLASHLYTAFTSSQNVKVIQVYNRSVSNLQFFENKVPITTSLEEVLPADIYLISISDDAIEEIITKISSFNGIIAHTSGSVPMLKSAKRNAVFYPLQTFSKTQKVDFSEIPICIEAENEKDLKTLHKLGESISTKVFPITTEQRKTLHLAAVFACNFTNQLYRIAEKICEKDNISFEILHALIAETARKALQDSPKNVQTGPAKRGDQKTIDRHLSQLNSSELKEIYTLITKSIQKEHGSKL